MVGLCCYSAYWLHVTYNGIKPTAYVTLTTPVFMLQVSDYWFGYGVSLLFHMIF